MFITALFTIAKIWPSIDARIKKMCCKYAMEYYRALTNEMLPFSPTWIVLKDIMSSKIS
jgi:hypothetical protein